MGDTKRPSADAEGLGVAQRLARLTLSLWEALEDFCGITAVWLSLLGKPVWHPSCTQES